MAPPPTGEFWPDSIGVRVTLALAEPEVAVDMPIVPPPLLTRRARLDGAGGSASANELPVVQSTEAGG